MRVFATLSALVLAGCALGGPNRIYYVVVDPAYKLNVFSFAGASGKMRTFVIGDPFAVGRERFDKAVTEAMYGHHFGPTVEFTTAPDAEVNASYKVVMMFDAPLAVGESTVCGFAATSEEAATVAAPPPDKPVRVAAAFCLGSRPLTHLVGEMARTGIDDPAFRSFVAFMTFQLFPASNPEARPDHDREPVIPEP